MIEFESGIRGKFLTVAQLRRVLARLPDDVCLSANGTGNIVVTNHNGRHVGHIDFLHDGEFNSALASAS